MKLFIITMIVIVAAIAGTAGYLVGTSAKSPAAVVAQNAIPELSPEVKAVLDKKLEVLTDLAKNTTIIDGVRKSNKDTQKLTQALINQEDQSWRKSSADSDVIKPYLVNATALELLKFQRTMPTMTEIFVVNGRGLNVGQTNKTSDFYQGDEDWWVQTFNKGEGKTHYGDMEFDESSRTEGIALYVPVFDPTSEKAIGVIKAILDLDAIRVEL